jgi:hypothetical protein
MARYKGVSVDPVGFDAGKKITGKKRGEVLELLEKGLGCTVA